MPTSRSRPAAFTLVELLVVIAIIGVLIGMLLPAIQRVRMTANRSQSMNNLHQIALASSNYQAANGSLPDFKTLLDKNNPTTKACSSVFVKLLPYLEQDNLYQAALQRGVLGLEATVKTYLSPADGSSRAGTVAFCSYVANDYLFALKEGASLPRSAPDGLSSTVLFSEHYMSVGSPPVYNCWPIAVDGIAVNKQMSTRAAHLNSAAPPQFLQPQQCAPEPASSPDPTAILVALADGSVRGVSRAAAAAPASYPASSVGNWQAALSPAGGETLGPDW